MSFFETLEKALKINVREHAKNSGLLVVGSFIAAIIGLGVNILFANLLSKETFGDYRFILGLLNTFNSFALTGMNVAVVQAVARGYEGTLMRAVRYQLRWAIPHAIGGLIAAVFFFSQGNTTAALCLTLIALVSPISNAFNTYSAFLQGKKQFKRFTGTNIIQALTVYGTITLALIGTENIVLITLANIGATLLSNLALHAYTLYRYKPNTSADPETITYGRNLSFLWGLRLAVDQLDTFLIHGFLGPASLASYAVITTIPERLKGFIKIGPSVVMPDHANRSLSEIVPPMRKKMALLFLALAVVSAFYALLCPPVFAVIYPLYTDIIPLAQLYGISLLFGLWSIPLTILFSQQESATLNKALIASSLLQAVMMASGLWLGGLLGVVIAKLSFQGIQMAGYMIGLEIAAKRQRAVASTR
jgi:O-antigen/teichoic acid export membrane protein